MGPAEFVTQTVFQLTVDRHGMSLGWHLGPPVYVECLWRDSSDLVKFGMPQGSVVGPLSMWRSDAMLVAVFSKAAVSVEVVGLWALTLDAGSIHVSCAGDLVLRVTPATQAGLEGDR